MIRTSKKNINNDNSPPEAIYEDEETAIAAGDEESVHKNYKFFGQEYE